MNRLIELIKDKIKQKQISNMKIVDFLEIIKILDTDDINEKLKIEVYVKSIWARLYSNFRTLIKSFNCSRICGKIY